MSSRREAASALFKIAFWAIAVGLTAALLTPVFWFLLRGFVEQGHLDWLERFPPHRYFSRIAQVAGVVLAVPLLLSLKLRSMADLELRRDTYWLRDLSWGLFLASLAAIPLFGIQFWLDAWRMRAEVNWAGLGNAAITAAAVSAIEELLFRGVLLGLLLRCLGKTWAVLISAFLFAGVHFVRPEGNPGSVAGWGMGFAMLADSLMGAFDGKFIVWGWLTLLLAGIVLGLARVWTQALWLPIGIHAAWVFGQQAANTIGRIRLKPANDLMPWVAEPLVSGAVPIGLSAVVSLCFLWSLVWLYVEKVRPRAA